MGVGVGGWVGGWAVGLRREQGFTRLVYIACHSIVLWFSAYLRHNQLASPIILIVTSLSRSPS